MIDELYVLLKSKYPLIEVEKRKADALDGYHFINIYFDDQAKAITVEWKPNSRIGLTHSYSDDPLDGLFGPPDEIYELYETVTDVFNRIVLILKENNINAS